jgi:hypothetical protein
VTTIKAKEPQAILTIESTRSASLLILEPASQLFLSLPARSSKKITVLAYQASPYSVISLSL